MCWILGTEKVVNYSSFTLKDRTEQVGGQGKSCMERDCMGIFGDVYDGLDFEGADEYAEIP